ncbi:MAG: ABC transporter ATP-binding protein [Tissierellia bacterium]|nr:ABC transporter ATP-binding protein [Tissierellia bacterium]
MNFLEVKDIHVSYGTKPIVKGVDLTVKDGEFVGIIGPNGSGKSTLLKAIYRVLPYISGDIFLKGQNMRAMAPKDSAKIISVVQQMDDIPFDFSIYDMVMMGRTPYKKFMERDNKEDVKIVHQSIAQVGLEGYENRSILELSGGERQRVILARALAQKAEGIILDEPTNHLDINYQLTLLELIKSLGVPCLCALHDINIALMYCDKIYALKDGKIVGFGSPEEVITPSLIENLYHIPSKIMYDEETKRHYILFLNKDPSSEI